MYDNLIKGDFFRCVNFNKLVFNPFIKLSGEKLSVRGIAVKGLGKLKDDLSWKTGILRKLGGCEEFNGKEMVGDRSRGAGHRVQALL